MNGDTTLDEDELRRRGFWEITRTLDDSEERGVAGHWANTSGKRLYSLSRVIEAEELMKAFQGGVYRHPKAEQFNSSSRPRTQAIIVVDYRCLLRKIDPKISHEIWSCRLSHRVAGRRPQSEDREKSYILGALAALVKFAGDPEPSSESALFEFLSVRSEGAAARLGPPWPDVILRRAVLGYDVSKGVSPRAARRLLDIYSLIHAGRIHGPLMKSGERGLVDTLVESPAMRFDHKILPAC
jgi:hypothetical protein